MGTGAVFLIWSLACNGMPLVFELRVADPIVRFIYWILIDLPGVGFFKFLSRRDGSSGLSFWNRTNLIIVIGGSWFRGNYSIMIEPIAIE